eukprot:TRINITY_DN6731_c0_g1_i1.p1 TRINITY_DN6731_c0_g1~~TRINITY_DN6731_c0_g1_i1.p1  ORF type:complete len:755 (+),score=261.34 TRINITY_DN6731_c0_g1_i1:1375-3639(+)
MVAGTSIPTISIALTNISRQAVTPYHASNSDVMSSKSFFVQPGYYVVSLLFGTVDPTAIICPYYELGIDIDPFEDVHDMLDCSSYEGFPEIPRNTIPLDQTGFELLWIESFLSSDLNNLRFISDFTVTQNSVLSLSVGFNGFVSAFDVKLTEKRASSSSATVSSITTTDSEQTYSTDLNMVTRISTPLQANKTYSLTLHPLLFGIPGSASFVRLCYPYNWVFQLSPIAADGPTVNSVSPPGSLSYPQDTDLILNVVFSETLYDEYGVKVSNDNKGSVVRAFFLQSSSNEDLMIQASYATQMDMIGLTWQLLFAGSKLQHGDNYLLGAHASALHSASLQPLIVPANHIYRIIPDCPDHMHWTQSGSTEITCTCDEGYAFSSPDQSECNTCASGFIGFPNCRQAATCDRCTHGTCNPISGVCECDAHYTGHSCDSCSFGWDLKSNCTACLDHFDLNYDCTRCIGHFAGTTCDTCATGFTGLNCDQCMPHRTGVNCDQCTSHWTGTNCDRCAFGFTGSNCDQCIDNFTGPNCDQCISHFTGPSCEQCVSGFTGSKCDKCVTHKTGPNCDECEGHFTGPNCDTCATGFTGSNCDECEGHKTGPNCDKCEVRWSGPNCDTCATGFAGSDCNKCAAHRNGVNCDVCDDNWTGSNCDRCVSNRAGENCTACAFNFKGKKCDECADGYSGDDCTTVESSHWSVLTISLTVVGGLTLLVFLGVIAFLIVLRIRSKHKGNFLYKPLGFDPEDTGIEMDQNLIMT